MNNTVHIVSYAYDENLGGIFFTNALIPYLLDRTMQKHKINPKDSPRAWIKFQEAAEKLKKTLSINPAVPFEIPSLMNDIDVNFIVKREDFNSKITDLIERIPTPILKALETANIKKEDLFAVEALGGGARVPLVKSKIVETLGKEISQTLNLDECFAIGTAYYAKMLNGEDKELEVSDVTPCEISASWKEGDQDKTQILFKHFSQAPSISSFLVNVNGHNTVKIGSDECTVGTIDLDIGENNQSNVEVTLSLSQSATVVFNGAKIIKPQDAQENAPQIQLTTTFSFNGDISPGKLDEFKKTLKERSSIDFESEYNNSNQILTLSTCDRTGKRRVLVHAGLEEISYNK